MLNNNQTTLVEAAQETAQERFNRTYISASEIIEILNVHRSTLLYARRTGKLPEPIIVNDQVLLWERESVQPYIAAWKIILDARRG